MNQLLERVIQAALRRVQQLEVRDYARLLNVAGPYSVQEVEVREGEWLAATPLADLNLTDEGILVLGIRRRDGGFRGAPTGETVLEPGDTAVVYGRDDAVAELSGRRAGVRGDRAHTEAKVAQRRVEERERDRDIQQRE